MEVESQYYETRGCYVKLSLVLHITLTCKLPKHLKFSIKTFLVALLMKVCLEMVLSKPISNKSVNTYSMQFSSNVYHF